MFESPSHTSWFMHPYRGPFLCVVVVILGSSWWALGEESRALDENHVNARRHVDSLAQGLTVMTTHLGDDVDARIGDHLHNHLLLGSPIEFIAIAREQHILAMVGDADPAPLALGLHPERERLIMRKSLSNRRARNRLCHDGELMASHRGPPWRWIDCSMPVAGISAPLDLYVGMRSGFRPGHRAQVLWRTVLLMLSMWGAAFIFAVAWGRSIRNRVLSRAFEVEHQQRLQLEDMNLAAAGVAHETLNPLGLILGLSQRLERDPTASASVKDTVEHIVDEADRASSRLSDFLNFANLRAPSLEPVNLQDVCQRIVHVLTPDFDAQGVTLACVSESMWVSCDASMLEQVIINLLLNSLHASEPDTQTTLRVGSSQQEGVTLSVEDQGRGIDQEHLEHVFKPYVTYEAGGHGLGLAIVRRIASQHGWRIDVQSDSTGTTVALSLLALISPKKS